MSNKDGKTKKNKLKSSVNSLKSSYNQNLEDKKPSKFFGNINYLHEKNKKRELKNSYNFEQKTKSSLKGYWNNNIDNTDNDSNTKVSPNKKSMVNTKSRENIKKENDKKNNKKKQKSTFAQNIKNDNDYLDNNYIKKKEEDEKAKKEKEEIERKKMEEEIERQKELLKKEKEKEERAKKEKEEEIKREEERIKKKEEKRKKEKRERKEKEENDLKNLPLESNFSSSSNSSLDTNVLKIITSKIGLKNLGNTCYMNTCLQNLIHSEYFIQNLFKYKSLISFDVNSDTPISKEFFKICEKYISLNDYDSYSPSYFKSEFGDKHRNFSGYGQQDTQEFCRILLEDMNKELNTVKVKIPYKELDTKNKSKIQCDKEFDDFFRKRENSFIMDVFYGQIINIFQCKYRDKNNYNAYCNQETYSFEKIMDLPLLLPKKMGSLNIDDLLDNYFEKMDIEFETKCEKCGRKSRHEKQMKFSHPPNILILSLQRIDRGGKNEVEVNFPNELDLNKYIDNEIYKDNTKYTLYGIGNHSGSINFGHYYAYIKLNDKNWYEYNDSHVSSYSSTISKRSAYILFYKKNK